MFPLLVFITQASCLFGEAIDLLHVPAPLITLAWPPAKKSKQSANRYFNDGLYFARTYVRSAGRENRQARHGTFKSNLASARNGASVC